MALNKLRSLTTQQGWRSKLCRHLRPNSSNLWPVL